MWTASPLSSGEKRTLKLCLDTFWQMCMLCNMFDLEVVQFNNVWIYIVLELVTDSLWYLDIENTSHYLKLTQFTVIAHSNQVCCSLVHMPSSLNSRILVSTVVGSLASIIILSKWFNSTWVFILSIIKHWLLVDLWYMAINSCGSLYTSKQKQ